jgi:hypothetical protein
MKPINLSKMLFSNLQYNFKDIDNYTDKNITTILSIKTSIGIKKKLNVYLWINLYYTGVWSVGYDGFQ